MTYLDNKQKTNSQMLTTIDTFQSSWHALGNKKDIEIL
jgi:hypothetical protein